MTCTSCPWLCPTLCPLDCPCSCPSPALRGADACTMRLAQRTARPARPARHPPASPARTSLSRQGTTWMRRAACAALVLAVAVAFALPPHALAERTTSTLESPGSTGATPSTTVHSSNRTSPLTHHSREVDDYGDDYSEPSRNHGQPRRLHSAEVADDDAVDTSLERRGRHRGARKQQQVKKKAAIISDEDIHLFDDDRLPPPPGHGGACSLCREREAIRNWSLDAIKEQILLKLNLHHPPNITGRRLPKYEHLADLVLDPQPRPGGRGGHAHGMLGDDPAAGVFRPGPEIFDEEDDYHAKMERIIAFPQSHSNKVRHGYQGQGQHVLHFRFSQRAMQSHVAKAVLWLYVRGTGNRYTDDLLDDDEDDDVDQEEEEGVRVVLSVRRMRGRGGQAGGTPDSPVPFEVEATTKVKQPEGDGMWVEVDVKKMVEDWFRRPRDNQGLMVYVSPSNDAEDRLLVNTDTNEDNNPKMPFIEVYLKDSRKRRVRRAVGLSCDENSEEVRCCRYPLVVDFERFGWDFIIFPKKYEANYCSGECPYVYMQKYPHTAIMHLARNKTGPCCAPRKMSAINMLYFDHDLNVVFGVLPGMVVERCGCL